MQAFRLKEDVLYFCVNSHRLYQRILLFSLSSLLFYRNSREEKKSYSVVVFVYGKAINDLKIFCEDQGVHLCERPALADIFSWSLKWVALTELVDCRRAIFCDVDTIFFSQPSELFLKTKRYDFIAQEEELQASQGMAHKVDSTKLRVLRQEAGAKPVAIFNSSVFVLSQKAILKLSKELGFILDLQRSLFGDQKRNPVHPQWFSMIEEVAVSLALGRVKGLRISKLESSLVSHYRELRKAILPTPKVILHIGNEYVPECLELLACEAESKSLAKIYRQVGKSYKSVF